MPRHKGGVEGEGRSFEPDKISRGREEGGDREVHQEGRRAGDKQPTDTECVANGLATSKAARTIGVR